MTLPRSAPEPGKTVAIIQSNYIPWKGYFDVINRADEFFLYDTVQYTRRDWRNRNRIKTAQGPQWLTIPVQASRAQRICDVEISDPLWAERHWRTLSQVYARAPYFVAVLERGGAHAQRGQRALHPGALRTAGDHHADRPYR